MINYRIDMNTNADNAMLLKRASAKKVFDHINISKSKSKEDQTDGLILKMIQCTWKNGPAGLGGK